MLKKVDNFKNVGATSVRIGIGIFYDKSYYPVRS